MSDEIRLIRERVLPAYRGLPGAACERFGSGLINRTYLVSAGAGEYVLQRVSPIFPPEIHFNIAAVTERLRACGVPTPELVPIADGRPFLDLGPDGVWRVMTRVPGISFPALGSPGQARGAAVLVGRFHAALEGLPHRFVGLRAGVHDTPAHLGRLRAALADLGAHRLHAQVAPLGRAILERAAALPALPDLPPRVCHGDLKIGNVIFAGPVPPDSERASALVDLDTVGPLPLTWELGDAWRSWCNRAGEDQPEASLDLEIFRASLDGWRAGVGRDLDADERRALALAPEWVSLELGARFAADALRESYFGWDPERFPGRGEHNLVRARGQWSLHQAFAASRDERTRLLGAGPRA